MAIELNNAHRDEILDATGARFDSGKLQIRTGAPPGAGEAAGGTLLVEIDVPASAFGASSGGGPIAKAGTWSGTATASGAPGHFRLLSSTDAEVREGTAGATGSGADMEIADLVDGDIIEGGTVTVDTYTIAQPASA